MSKKSTNDDDFESLIDEFDTIEIDNYPNVPAYPPFPGVPKLPVFPREPSLSEREKNLLISRRNRLFDEYISMLRETLNQTTRICPQAKMSNKIRNNLTKINNLVSDIKTIDRNLEHTGGKNNKKTRRKNKRLKLHKRTTNNRRSLKQK